MVPSGLLDDLKVSHFCPGLALRGYPGARVQNVCADEIIYSLGDDEPMPHFVVLDLGTNDLEDSGPLVLATRLFDLAEKLVAFGVLKVVICQILHRGIGRARNTNDFNTDADKCNKYIRVMAEDHPHISIHYHKGMISFPVPKWSDDGLHPHGFKYMKSLRLAVQRAALSCQVILTSFIFIFYKKKKFTLGFNFASMFI